MLNNLPPGQYTIFSPTLGFWHPEHDFSFDLSNIVFTDGKLLGNVTLTLFHGCNARFVSSTQIAKQLRTLLQEMDSSSPRKQD